MEKEIKVEGVTNVERVIVNDQLVGLSPEQAEEMAIAMAGNLMKAILSREKIALAVIEHMINSGNHKAAARILCAMNMMSCNNRVKFNSMIESKVLQISESCSKAIKERIAGSDMGINPQDVVTMLGELPDY